MATRRRFCLAAAASGAWVTLGGCGFALRRPPPMPFKRMALAGFAPKSPLALEFRQALGPEVQVVEAMSQADVVLVALLDAREKGVVASTSAVQVREVQLRVKFSFRVQTPSGRVLLPASELLLTRDMSYNETQALAKEREEAELYRDMQVDVVTQVLRRMSTLKA